jgi:hypothetical protein
MPDVPLHRCRRLLLKVQLTGQCRFAGKMLKNQVERALRGIQQRLRMSGCGFECPLPNRLWVYTQKATAPVP